jgi:hypothetical protein
MDNLRKAALTTLKNKYFLVGKEDRSVSCQTHRMVDAMIEFLIETQPNEMQRLSEAEKTLNKVVDSLQQKLENIEHELRHSQNNCKGLMQEIGEKEVLVEAFDKVRKLFAGRTWLMEGRGLYPYDDDQYKLEVRWMFDEFEKIKNRTWNNIRTKTFEYKQKLIAEYEGDLKARNKMLLEIIHKFQDLCLKEYPVLSDIVDHSQDIKMSYGIDETLIEDEKQSTEIRGLDNNIGSR